MHKHFMLEALGQAWLGRGHCSPNPGVGAVAVSNNQIIAKGSHQKAGTPHAEQLVLNQIPDNLNDVVLYVTLEPCNHWGKTPPCVESIIHSGVKEVVYGYKDPNPLVATNNTPQILQNKGIKVTYYPLPEIEHFYQSYHHWTLTGKPWVTAKIAQTLDGKVAGINGQRLQLSNHLCAEFTHKKRLHSDILLTTAETVRLDNPQFDVRLPNINQKKMVAILDRTLKLRSDSIIFNTASHCLIFHDKQYSVVNPIDNCTYQPIETDNELLDLSEIIQFLGQNGFHDVWVEAGGKLFSELHKKQLVDRTFFYIVPKVLGDLAVSGYHCDHIFNRQHTVNWEAKADNVIMRIDWKSN